MPGSHSGPNRPPRPPPPCPVHRPSIRRGRLYYDGKSRRWCHKTKTFDSDFDSFSEFSDDDSNDRSFVAHEEREREHQEKTHNVRSQLTAKGYADEDGISPFDHENEASRRKYGHVGQRMTREQARAFRRWRLNHEAKVKRLWREQDEAMDASRRFDRSDAPPGRWRQRSSSRGEYGTRGWGWDSRDTMRGREKDRYRQRESSRGGRGKDGRSESATTRCGSSIHSRASGDRAGHGGAPRSKHVRFTSSTGREHGRY